MLADRRDPAGAGSPDRDSEHPSVQGKVDAFPFHAAPAGPARIAPVTSEIAGLRRLAVNRLTMQFKDGRWPAELNTVLLNGEMRVWWAASGEFFCNHSNRLKARSYVQQTLFFGYCNGHGMYFPTIEAASEGGYGADSLGVSLSRDRRRREDDGPGPDQPLCPARQIQTSRRGCAAVGPACDSTGGTHFDGSVEVRAGHLPFLSCPSSRLGTHVLEAPASRPDSAFGGFDSPGATA